MRSRETRVLTPVDPLGLRGNVAANRARRATRKAIREARAKAHRKETAADRVAEATGLPRALVAFAFDLEDLSPSNIADERLNTLNDARLRLQEHIANVLDARERLNREIHRIEVQIHDEYQRARYASQRTARGT